MIASEGLGGHEGYQGGYARRLSFEQVGWGLLVSGNFVGIFLGF